MQGWRYRVNIKELFDAERDDEDAQAIEAAPEAAVRIKALSSRVRDARLCNDLREIAERFEDLLNEPEPARMFNKILSELYDVGDHYRISVC